MTPQTSTSTTSKSDSTTATQGINADHVLVRLTRERVAANWDKFRPAIRESLPPQIAVSNKAMKNILHALLAGRGTVWAYVANDAIHGIMVTTKYRDPLSGSTSLLIYAIYAFTKVTPEIVENAMETIRAHAQAEGTDEIIAFASNEIASKFYRQIGADVDTRLIRFEV